MAQPTTTPPPPPAKQAVAWKRWEIICLMKKEMELLSRDTCHGLTFDSSWTKMEFLIEEMESVTHTFIRQDEQMSSEKKHYWLVYYSHKDNGVHTEGHVVLSTKHSYFNQANMNRVREGIPKDALIVSINHIGEMTEEEFKGEE